MANLAHSVTLKDRPDATGARNCDQQIVRSNAGAIEAQKERLVPELIAAQAARTPDDRALIAGCKVLTYRELDSRANQLAHYLRTMGVGPEVLVGVWLERSVEFVIAALAIMKAGGAYLPLDPATPKVRLGAILCDSQVSVCITTRKMSELMPAGDWGVLSIDADWDAISRHSSTSPEVTLTSANLAYVIYTSGSTGEPRGVEITHASLSNLSVWHREAFGVTSHDRSTQLASPGFDAAVWEIWPYLISGASLYIAERFTIASPTALRDWLISERITISFVPTALAERLIKLAWPQRTSLRLLLTGADTLRRYPTPDLPFTVVNNYGPTECTVVATSGAVPAGSHSELLPPIGRPIANTKIYILNPNQKQVPVGVPGELHISGDCVARCYRNRPDLTVQKFIPNPFTADPASRLYRTGDLACYLPDGQIAFLGRMDEQIKIRGYRVEPNEIAVALEKHPTVQDCVIVSRDDVSGEKVLVAYIVPMPNSQLNDGDLRVFLATLLPPYMMPSLFVRLDSFPVTSNGKIDRSALPPADAFNTVRQRSLVAPRTPVEERVALILCPLLQLSKISVEDNFFMLGGHSLLGTQLIARVRDTFGVEITLRALFDSPTVSGISSEIEKLILAKLESGERGDGHGLLIAHTAQGHNCDEEQRGS